LYKDLKKMRNERGFTLIELLVVIVILGILAAVVVFAVSGLTNKGQSSACRIDERTLRTAEEASFAQDGKYRDMGADGDTAADDTLVGKGFLDNASVDHTVALVAGPPQSYKITPAGKCA
jgi:general secretion pathway protein G